MEYTVRQKNHLMGGSYLNLVVGASKEFEGFHLFDKLLCVFRRCTCCGVLAEDCLHTAYVSVVLNELAFKAILGEAMKAAYSVSFGFSRRFVLTVPVKLI